MTTEHSSKITVLKAVLVALFVAATLLMTAAPAQAYEYVQNPVSGEYWSCGDYTTGYWCYVPSYGGWIRAVPGFQYGALGG